MLVVCLLTSVPTLPLSISLFLIILSHIVVGSDFRVCSLYLALFRLRRKCIRSCARYLCSSFYSLNILWVGPGMKRCSIFPTSPNTNNISPGYRGQNCEIDIDDCPGHLCQNGATCIDGLNSYTCECPPTFTGTLCESDVDECALRYVA